MLVGLLLADCAGDNNLRWIEGAKEDVVVEGATYRVVSLATSEGFDFRSHRNESLVLAPDELVEKRRNRAAVLQVAGRLCGGKAPSVTMDGKSGSMFVTSVRCG